MQRLTPFAKGLIGVIGAGTIWAAVHTYGTSSASDASKRVGAEPSAAREPAAPGASGPAAQASATAAALKPASSVANIDNRPVRVALSQWPGHMALVVGAGGLTTQPGSPAAAEGLNLEIQFIEDAASKNKALAAGDVDFVWQTVDEMPISLGSFAEAQVDVRAFLQIDWSRGGDACVASAEIQEVEDILGHGSAMLMFSPDHTVFEFMIANSRLTPRQVADIRSATQFSLDDFTFGRKLFAQGSVDVACLWEPNGTLALNE